MYINEICSQGSLIQRAVLKEMVEPKTKDIPFLLIKKDETEPIILTVDKAVVWACIDGERKAYTLDKIKELLDDGWKPMRAFPMVYNESFDYKAQVLADFEDGKSYVIDQFNGMWALASKTEEGVKIQPIGKNKASRYFYIGGNSSRKSTILKIEEGSALHLDIDEFVRKLILMMKDSSTVEVSYDNGRKGMRLTEHTNVVLKSLIDFAETQKDNGVLLEYLTQGYNYKDVLNLRPVVSLNRKRESVLVTHVAQGVFRYYTSGYMNMMYEDNGEDLQGLLENEVLPTRIFPLDVNNRGVWRKQIREGFKTNRAFEVRQLPNSMHVLVECDNDGAIITAIKDGPLTNKFLRNGKPDGLAITFDENGKRYSCDEVMNLFDVWFRDHSFVEVMMPTELTQANVESGFDEHLLATAYCKYLDGFKKTEFAEDRFKQDIEATAVFNSLPAISQEALMEFCTNSEVQNERVMFRNNVSGHVVSVTKNGMLFTYVSANLGLTSRTDQGQTLQRLLETEFTPDIVFPRREISTIELLSFFADVSQNEEATQWYVQLPTVEKAFHVELRPGSVALLADPEFGEIDLEKEIKFSLSDETTSCMNYYDFGDLILNLRTRYNAIIEWSYGQTIDEILEKQNSAY